MVPTLTGSMSLSTPAPELKYATLWDAGFPPPCSAAKLACSLPRERAGASTVTLTARFLVPPLLLSTGTVAAYSVVPVYNIGEGAVQFGIDLLRGELVSW